MVQKKFEITLPNKAQIMLFLQSLIPKVLGHATGSYTKSGI